MTVETFILVAGFTVTILTIVYNRGKQDSRFDGHEALDASRFADIKKDIETMQKDIKELLKR